MNIETYLEKMKNIEFNLLYFLDNENDSNNEYQDLLNRFDELKIQENKHMLIALFHLITKIAENHFHRPFFYEKVEKIISYFKNPIKDNFSNTEIFSIFKSNKRLLLYLIEEKMMLMNEHIVKRMTSIRKYIQSKYPQYFAPEISKFLANSKNENYEDEYSDDDEYEFDDKDWVKEINNDLPEDFFEKRKNGEKEGSIYKLIQKDSIEEFIIYINKHNISVKSTLEPSIFEPSSFLFKKTNPANKLKFLLIRTVETKLKTEISLIEYAAFCGSIQIFKYLLMNGANLTSKIWLHAIHGQNAEIINILEEEGIKPNDGKYKKYFIEAIKCHHNDIANYILEKYLKNGEENSVDIFNKYLKYYNFYFVKNNLIDESSFFNLCQYDHCVLVDFLLKRKGDGLINKMNIYSF